MSWLLTLMKVSVVLSIILIGLWTFAVIVSAVLGRTDWLRPRAETAEQRARREQVQAWVDKRAKAAGIGMAGVSLGLPIGLMVAVLTKQRTATGGDP